MKDPYLRLRSGCYTCNISMAVIGNLSPILFLTFRTMYGISYSLLGLLVLVNFTTQLLVDLVFSFFSHKFNIPKAVKFAPVLCAIGLALYAVWPWIFPQAVYAGLVMGTVIFSAASGFCEVLISPVIAAIPAEDPDREMSKLHSIYAWGVVGMVVVSTLFLLLVGMHRWQWLAILFLAVPLSSIMLFSGVQIPKMETPERVSGALKLLKNKTLWLCVIAIFLGGASECTMAQWCSGYMEKALGIEKVWGDLFGVAAFAVMLGLGRSLYAKMGRNIGKVLFVGAIGATACYLVAAITSIPVVGLAACALTGLCVSMMWPGSLVVASERILHGGVFIYAMMAAGGDLGASVGPQLVGVVTDFAMANPWTVQLASQLSIAPEQLGMKLGMLVGMLFPLAGIGIYCYIMKTQKKQVK